MARLIPAALIASVIALVLIAGLVDSIIGGEWDHFAVFLIALGLVTFLIARTRRTRPTVTLRKDLNHWVTDYSDRTGHHRPCGGRPPQKGRPRRGSYRAPRDR